MGKCLNLNLGRSTPASGDFQSFADTHADGRVAPISAVRLTTIDRRKSTLSSRS
jgi:hypothetical protein